MARHFSGSRLVVATHNPGKLREIAELVVPFGVQVESAKALGLPEPEETGATFIENAELKARAAARASGLPALADDSGLSISALGGQPGIYAARWAGPTKDFNIAMRRVHEELKGTSDARAHFTCALSLCWPPEAPGAEPHCESFEGYVYGHLCWPPRGDRGFGYDPIFIPDGRHETFGEMDPAEKHAMSHRAHAFRQLVEACFSDPPPSDAGR